VTITPSGIDGEVNEVQFAGKHKDVVLVTTKYTGSVWRSSDTGKSWSSITDALSEDVSDFAGAFSIVPNPVNPEIVFVVGLEEQCWLSTDGGKNFKKVDTGFTLRGFKWHPFQEKWAVAYKSNIECIRLRKYRCFGDLMLTEDSGMTWRSIAQYVKYPNYAWLQSAGTKGEAKGLAIVQHKRDKGVAQSWDTELDFVQSDNFFQDKQVLLPKGNNFAIIDKYVFVAVANTNTEVTLWVSTNNAASFSIVRMPVELAERSYGILHTAEQSLFVIVRGGSIGAKWGNLYQSDESGTQMALSLSNNHYERGRNADIVKVQGIEGVYIVNVLLNPDADHSESPPELQTMITFDKGGAWMPLKAPSVDSTGVHYPGCSNGQCHLHLFFKGNPMKYSPIYSTTSSTGLILATGVVAPYMREDMRPDELGTFFSRDGGRSWSEVRKGTASYEFGDHGSLLVVGSNQFKTDTVKYSWDEGLTWETAQLGVSMEIDNIRTEPKATSQKFIVTGRTSTGKGHVVHLDFAAMHKRQCRGEDTPGHAGSDYEVWSPRDPAGGGDSSCVLGRTIQYTRRKQSSKCFNGVERERVTIRENCPCTRVDFECDVGFEMEGEGDASKCMPSHQENVPAEEEEFNRDMETLYAKPEKLNLFCTKYPDKEEFYVPSGFRRIPGDTCYGGLDLHEKHLECQSRTVSHTGFGVLIILVILAAVMGGVTLLSRHERFRYAVQNMGDNMPYVKYLVIGGSDHQPESVFDEDFALDCDDNDEPEVIPDVGYEPKRPSPTGSMGSPVSSAPTAQGGGAPGPASHSFDDFSAGEDPFNPSVAAVDNDFEDLLGTNEL